jgi:hypothetical protein
MTIPMDYINTIVDRLARPAAPYVHITSLPTDGLGIGRIRAATTIVSSGSIRVHDMDGRRMGTHDDAVKEVVRVWSLGVTDQIGWAGIEDLLQAVEEPVGRLTIVSHASDIGNDQGDVFAVFVRLVDFVGQEWAEDLPVELGGGFPHPPLPFHAILHGPDLGFLERRIRAEVAEVQIGVI